MQDDDTVLPLNPIGSTWLFAEQQNRTKATRMLGKGKETIKDSYSLLSIYKKVDVGWMVSSKYFLL